MVQPVASAEGALTADLIAYAREPLAAYKCPRSIETAPVPLRAAGRSGPQPARSQPTSAYQRILGRAPL